MLTSSLTQRWQALSAEQDALYTGADDLTEREARIMEIRNAALVWEMVQIEVEMGTQEIDDDYRNWKRAGERARKYLERAKR